MTFTYVEPSNSVRDKVRFLIGDHMEDKHLVEDEEIAFALDAADNDVNRACAILCDAIAARFAREAEVRVTSYATDRRTIYEKYKQLAKEFRNSCITTACFICPSISVADKEAIEEDATLTKPAFKRGLFDNPDIEAAVSEDEL